MTIFIFKLNTGASYIVPIFYSILNRTYEEQAWINLSNRLSRREELVRKQATLMHTINEWNSKIVKI